MPRRTRLRTEKRVAALETIAASQRPIQTHVFKITRDQIAEVLEILDEALDLESHLLESGLPADDVERLIK